MKNKLLIALVALAACLVTGSCSVQKRHYRPGLYVSKVAKKKQPVPTVELEKHKADESSRSALSYVQPAEEALYASAELQTPPAITRLANPPSLSPPDSCDLVIMRSGEEVAVKIFEIDPQFVRYKRCDNLSGPVYTVKKSEIFMVKYANGTREVIKSPEEQVGQPQSRGPAASSTLQAKPAKRIVGLSIFSFLASLVALLFPIELLALVVILEVAAFIAAIASLGKINKYPDYYSGRAFAIIGLVISTLAIGLLLVYFSLI